MRADRTAKRVTCPVCGKRGVALRETGCMYEHWLKSTPGAGFHGLGTQCRGSKKKPEDFR